MSEPRFSILIPSRNRLELLRHALASVLTQDYSDFEVIVADNASDQLYENQLPRFDHANIRFLRSEQPISVTENWNRAIEAAQGEYVIMLGDDDALTPGLLRRLEELIRRFERPDVIYLMAYHYAYPGVFEASPKGSFSIVNNSPVFDMAPDPFLLETERAHELGRLALQFRHQISFNAQHFVLRRAYIQNLSVKPFYQSPYPDYFACFVTFLTARRIIVVPSPEIIIGISKQSFGFYFANNRETEGFKQFLGEGLDEQALANGDERVRYALRHPGSEHTRNWLLAAVFAKRALHDVCSLSIDLRRYCRLQSFELAYRAGYLKTLDRKKFWMDCENLNETDKSYIKQLFWLFRTIDRVAEIPRASASHGLYNLMNVYHTPKIYMLEIGAHETIMDAVRWLEPPPTILTSGSVTSKQQKEITISNASSVSKSAEMSGLNELIKGLKDSLAEDERLAGEHRAELKITLAKQNYEIQQLQNRLAQITRSSSWRVTRLLRAGGRVLRWIKREFARHAAPLSRNFKDKPAFQKKGSSVYDLLAKSGLFDIEYYRSKYPDVRDRGVDPLEHFISHGAAENRDPNQEFNTSYYLTANLDVAASGINPLLHYFLHGAAEGRAAVPYETLIRDSGLFDADWYLERYPDVKAQGLDPLRHFVTQGLQENRDPNPLFNAAWYLRIYADIAAAGAVPLLHYIMSGSAEGRQPSAGFDANWYLEQYPDVSVSGENPLAHYLRIGRQSLRLPCDPNAEYRPEVINECQQLALEAPELRRHIDVMLILPKFCIYIEGENSEARQRTMSSLERQIYSKYTVVKELGASTFHDFASEDTIGFFLWLRAGDVINERGLYEFASAINKDPSVELLYADQDLVSPVGVRSKPFYKPDWSPDYLESFNYIGYAACFRTSIAASIIRTSSCFYDFVLRFVERARHIAHIRKVLLHVQKDVLQTKSQEDVDLEIHALNERLKRTGRTGQIKPIAQGLGCYDIKINLKASPLISVVIPTAGKTVRINNTDIDLLTSCLDLLVERSTYKNLEFIIVDNGDLGEIRTNDLRRRQCKLITYSEAKFNIAAKLNLGVSMATGEMLLLLNDDIEPINSDWIERMLEHFEKPHVGVVGARLLYPDHRTQHVGVVLNSRNPDHVRPCGVRNYMAVTGAAMMTRASDYRNVGGYTEELATSYNDTDYCLKLIERGLTVVYTPRAELVHFESQSREARLDAADAEYFAKRWAPIVTSDPFYNENNLTVASPTYETRQTSRQI